MKAPPMVRLALSLVCLAAGAGIAQAGSQEGGSPPAGQADTPAASAGCGRISTFNAASRSNDLFRARVLEIDGKLAGPTQPGYRVTAGPHTLTIVELIDPIEFNDLQLRQRGSGRDLSKTLEIDVKPNTTYMIAAHLLDLKSASLYDKKYWEPVVYHQSTEACR